jgi:hypothetical protein
MGLGLGRLCIEQFSRQLTRGNGLLAVRVKQQRVES